MVNNLTSYFIDLETKFIEKFSLESRGIYISSEEDIATGIEETCKFLNS